MKKTSVVLSTFISPTLALKMSLETFEGGYQKTVSLTGGRSDDGCYKKSESHDFSPQFHSNANNLLGGVHKRDVFTASQMTLHSGQLSTSVIFQQKGFLESSTRTDKELSLFRHRTSESISSFSSLNLVLQESFQGLGGMLDSVYCCVQERLLQFLAQVLTVKQTLQNIFPNIIKELICLLKREVRLSIPRKELVLKQFLRLLQLFRISIDSG